MIKCFIMELYSHRYKMHNQIFQSAILLFIRQHISICFLSSSCCHSNTGLTRAFSYPKVPVIRLSKANWDYQSLDLITLFSLFPWAANGVCLEQHQCQTSREKAWAGTLLGPDGTYVHSHIYCSGGGSAVCVCLWGGGRLNRKCHLPMWVPNVLQLWTFQTSTNHFIIYIW